MAMAGGFGPPILVLAALCSSAASQTTTVTQTPPSDDNGTVYYDGAENTWITEDDRQVSLWAKAAVARWCAGPYKGDLDKVAAARDDIQNEVGDNNIFMTILESNATTMEDIQPILRENMRSFGMVVLPFLMVILTLIVWFCCCCSECCALCCKKRGCERKRSPENPLCGGVQVIIMLVCFLVLGVIYLGITSSHGDVVDGIDNLICASSQLLDTALNGENTTSGTKGFIGMMPVLGKFFWIEQQMKTNSPLLREFEVILDRTAQIEDSVVLVADTLKLLSHALNDPKNMYPKEQDGSDLFHTCLLCEQAGPIVEQMTEGLEEGIGNALNKARAEVKSQLTYSKRKELTSAATSAAEPLKEAKDQLTQFLKVFVDPDAITDDQKKQLDDSLGNAFLLVSGLAMLLVLCGCCSTGCCIVIKPKVNDDGITKRRSGVAPGCACCVWCLSFLFIILVLLVTFVLNVIVAPSTQICGFMEALDSNVLTTIGESQGTNMTEDNFVMAKGLVDVCWDGTKINGGSNMLDLLFMRKEDGTKEYMRDKLVGDITTPIDAAFGEITSKLGNVSMNLADLPAFIELKNMLASNDVRNSLTVSQQHIPAGSPPAGGWADNVKFQGMFKDEDIAAKIVAVSKCDDYTDTLTGSNQVLPGITKYVNLIRAFPGSSWTNGGSPGDPSCVNGMPREVTCPTTPVDDKDVCEAGKAFMDLKAKFADTANDIFSCNTFIKNKTGGVCDPLNMGIAPTYLNDCLRNHEAGYTFTEIGNVSCNTADFASYLQDFGNPNGRLDQVITRLDTVTAEVLDIIVTDMRALVDKYFVDQIDEVADGISCGFLPPIKDTVINALCFQGLAGFKAIANMYFITVLLVILLCIDMYVLRRCFIDNGTLERIEAKKNGGAGEAGGTI